MTKPDPTTRRQGNRARGPKAVAPRVPPLGPRLLDAILETTRSRWWEAGQPEIERLSQPAGSDGGHDRFPLPAPPEASVPRIAPADLKRAAAFFASLAETPLPCSLEFRLAGPTGDTWVRLHVLHRTGRAATRHYSGILSDISPQKKLEGELLQISEREQNRIGQDLHDDLCQVLAGLSCLTRVLENRLAPKLPEEVDNLREINRQLVDAMDRTRALTHGLYPTRMRSGDARSVLLELAKQVGIRFGVTVRTAFRGRFPAHSAHEILQVYRIAQEAISNAIRHGRAERIDLTLESRRDGMRLTVRDHGIGLPSDPSARQGIGLQIMQHRAAQIGAKIQIGDAPRRGVLVALHYQPSAPL